MIEQSSQEVIEVYRQMLWKQQKKESREGRCLNPDGTRCQKTSCAKCERIQKIDIKNPCNGLPRSLDEMEESGCLMPASDMFTSPEGRVIQQETSLELRAAIDSLDETDRELISLYYFEGFNERQVGRLIGMKQKTVNNHKKSCLKKMAKVLGKNQ